MIFIQAEVQVNVYTCVRAFCECIGKKHKLSFSYVHKGKKMVQKIFSYDNYFQSYARLNALNTESVNARNPCSKMSLEN